MPRLPWRSAKATPSRSPEFAALAERGAPVVAVPQFQVVPAHDVQRRPRPGEGQQPHGIADAIPHFREVRKQASIRRLLKQYPDLDQLVDDMFTGGLIIGLHRDYQVRAFGKTAAEAWTSGNHLGAILRAGMSLPQTMMKPLFQWYIPNLKYSLFLKRSLLWFGC